MSDQHTNRIIELTRQLEELRKRMPAHSIPPALMVELDDLEEELAKEIARQAESRESSGSNGVFMV